MIDAREAAAANPQQVVAIAASNLEDMQRLFRFEGLDEECIAAWRAELLNRIVAAPIDSRLDIRRLQWRFLKSERKTKSPSLW
jgi:hypothetical protein